MPPGYCAGAITGMVIFFSVLDSLLSGLFPRLVPKAAASTAGIVFIVAVGIVLKFAMASRGRAGFHW